MDKQAISGELKTRSLLERRARTKAYSDLQSKKVDIKPGKEFMSKLRPKGIFGGLEHNYITAAEPSTEDVNKRVKQIVGNNYSPKVPASFSLSDHVNTIKVKKIIGEQQPMKASPMKKIIGGLALAGAAYGGKKMYDHYTSKQRLEKAAMINACMEEIQKIGMESEKAKDHKDPPKWLNDAMDIGGFIGGTAVGTYSGDVLAHKLLKIKSPAARNFARYVGGGLAAYGTMKALPMLRDAAPDKVKELLPDENK